MNDYREFLRMLRLEPGKPTLFCPCPTRAITTQLIWRGGDSLWDTPAHRTETLISLYTYLNADTAVIRADAGEIDEVLSCAHLLPPGLRFTIRSDDSRVLEAADRQDSVCALASSAALYGGDFAKPLLFLSDGSEASIDAAISRGAAGVHIPREIERLWQLYGRRIALLGGLGIETVSGGEPIDIHSRIRALHERTHGAGWAIGTGLCDDAAEVAYLGFISMLGIYNNLRKAT